MNTEPTTAEKLRALPWDIAFAAGNSIFAQLTLLGSVFILFLDELGLSKAAIGSLLSLIPFTNVIALLIAPAVGRFGYKRTFVTFMTARTAFAAPLMLVPWVISRFEPHVTLLFVGGIVTVFAISRAVAFTARMPWVQEFVPDTVRGKFTATRNIFGQLASFVTVMVAGYVLERSTNLSGFTFLFAVGVLFGLVGIWAVSHVPGGAPTGESRTERTSHFGLVKAAHDSNFSIYMLGAGLFLLGTGPLASFLPLFMQEQVGLNAGNVVRLQNGTLLGGLLSGYLWGWLADRYGGKPVMMSSISLRVLLPICWLLMPRHSAWSLYAALGIAVLQGVANVGWVIGSVRLRFVSIIPSEGRRDYLALFFAFMGIVGGLGQVVGGWLLDLSKGVTGRFLVFSLDSYSVLFFVSLALLVVAGMLMGRVRGDSRFSTGEFATLFLRGNPFKALASLIRYRRASDERAVVTTTERLGRTQSPLTEDELLEALADPRFFVRFEAIVSIARRGPDPRLTEALVKVLNGTEPALSTIAAWALGRIGDEQALQPLRDGLNARHRSVQAYCARSLGILGDTEVVPLFVERLKLEADAGLQVAYASALGNLGATQAVERLLTLLWHCQDPGSRRELALALARIVGDGHHFVELSRRTQANTHAVISGAVTGLQEPLAEVEIEGCDLAALLDDCSDALARQELERGVGLLCRVIRCLPREEFGPTDGKILQDCGQRLGDCGAERTEYLLLALHALHVGLTKKHPASLVHVFH